MSFPPETPEWYRRMLEQQEAIRKAFEPPPSILAKLETQKRLLAEQTDRHQHLLHSQESILTSIQQAYGNAGANSLRWQDLATSFYPNLDAVSSLLRAAGLDGTKASVHWLRDRIEETARTFDDAPLEEYDDHGAEEGAPEEEIPIESSRLVIPAPRDFVLLCTEINETMLRDLVDDPRKILEFSPRQFEELIGDLFRGFGYEVELTARTRDGGCDVIAVRKAEIETRNLIECKRYDPSSHNVGVRIVRELHGVVTSHRATKGIIATTSYFTRDAKQHIEQNHWQLEGHDLDGVMRWVQKYLHLRATDRKR